MEEANQYNNIDPNSITTQNLFREIGSLKELMMTHVHRIDKAAALAHEDSIRSPTEMQKAISGIKELHERDIKYLHELINEKFEGIAQRFIERDARFDEKSKDATLIAKTALEASERAVSKSEISFTKQIDQQDIAIEK